MSPEQVTADPPPWTFGRTCTQGWSSDCWRIGCHPWTACPCRRWRGVTAAGAVAARLARRGCGGVETIVAAEQDRRARNRRRTCGGHPAAPGTRAARPPSALYHLGKFARRHKTLVATTAAFLLAQGPELVAAWRQATLAQTAPPGGEASAPQPRHPTPWLVAPFAGTADAADPGLWTETRAMARQATLVRNGPGPGWPARRRPEREWTKYADHEATRPPGEGRILADVDV